MNKQAVAERINLTFQDNQKHEVELPFRILVLSNITADERAENLVDHTVLKIDANITDILGRQNISVKLALENYLRPHIDGPLMVNYSLNNLEDFSPENLIRGIPELRQALKMHSMLSDEKVKPAMLASLLTEFGFTDQKNLNSSDKLIIQAEIASRISKQLDGIIQHDRFVTLETSWRSLDFLQHHINTRENTELVVINTSKDGLLEDFEDSPDITQSSLYQTVYSAEFGQFGGRPYGLMLGDFEFKSTARDMALLQQLAKLGAMSHCPVISAADASFFGIDDYKDFSRIRDIDAHFEQPMYAKWNSFRSHPDSQYVSLTLPRFLLRPSHDHHSSEFGYEESNRGIKGGLWGNSAYALVTRFCNSFANYRWFVNVTGDEYGIINNLKVQAGYGAVRSHIPTEVMISDRSEPDLVHNGFTPLTLHKASQKAGFFAAPSCRKEDDHPLNADGRQQALNQRLEIQLPYMLISCRFSQYIKIMQRENIGSWQTRPQLDQALNGWLKQYVSDMDNPAPSVRARRPLRNARVTVREVEGNSSWFVVTISLTPHFKYMGLPFTLTERSKLEKA
jgi:type VI secretion system protein ImpC